MAERGDGRARRRRTSADVQWAKVHGRHLSIPIEWLDKRRHDHVALGRGFWLQRYNEQWQRLLAGREYCLHRKIYFCEARDVRGRLTLMRFEEKEGKIELAEGLSQ